jgi:hypothetical protein
MEEWAAETGKEMLNGELVGRYVDPGLTSPGRASLSDPGLLDPVHLPEYLPVAGAPVIDGGLDLGALFNLDTGGKDILGTAVPSGGTYDIGAVEYISE